MDLYEPEIGIDKTVDPAGPVRAGEEVTWTLDITNDGIDPIRRAVVTDPLPADPFIDRESSVLLNLASTVPPFFERFARVAEFLDARPDVRSAGRERFKTYRGKSIEPQTHNV